MVTFSLDLLFFFHIDPVPEYNLCCPIEAVVFILWDTHGLQERICQSTSTGSYLQIIQQFLHGARYLHIILISGPI